MSEESTSGYRTRRSFNGLYDMQDYLDGLSDQERKAVSFVSWSGRYIVIFIPDPASTEVCQDCSTGTSHTVGSPDDVPLWRNPKERSAYGRWAELIELEDEMNHMWE